jgi:ribose transport system permease protein
MGIVSGLAGVMWLGSPVTDAEQGSSLVLMAIAGAIIGGTSLSGGRGTAIGAVIGTLIVQVILSGITPFGIDATWTPFVIGAVMVLSLALDRLAKVPRNRGAGRNAENPHA